VSVKIQARVWEYSQHGGTALLMLLAIADFADDDGRAYPAVATLAAKCRMQPRNANVILATLRKSGDLAIRIGEGPKGTNLYHVLPLQSIAPLQDIAPLHSNASPPAIQGIYPLQRSAVNPSVNHHEPPRGLPTCPVQRIVDAYHRLMPDNPKCKVINDARMAQIKKRWKEAARLTCKPFGYATAKDGIAAWEKFFAICAESLFLTGRAPPQPGKPPFVADIDFLFSPSAFAKCLENKYHREAA